MISTPTVRSTLCSAQPLPLLLAPSCCILESDCRCCTLAQAHLHGLGVLHCDIKASNVLLQPNARHALGHAVLSDFGVATTVGMRREDNLDGSTRYMAPEVRGALLSIRSSPNPHTPDALNDVGVRDRTGGGSL